MVASTSINPTFLTKLSHTCSVGHAFRARFLELADSTDPEIYNAMYEYIDIDVHAPVLDLPEYIERPKRLKPSKVVIQGNFQSDRRDYPHIFEDLIEALQRKSILSGSITHIR